MTIDTLRLLVNVVSAIAAFTAAGFWFRAATVKVPPSDEPDAEDIQQGQIISQGADVIATASEQARWNKWGACAAAVAALLQTVVIFLLHS